RSLWLRLLAAIIAVCLILLALGSPREQALEVAQLAALGAQVINLASFAMLALGCLASARAELPELRRLPLMVGAALCLGWPGVVGAQLPALHGELQRRSWMYASDQLGAWSIAPPLVLIATIALLAVALHTITSKRGLADGRRGGARTGQSAVV